MKYSFKYRLPENTYILGTKSWVLKRLDKHNYELEYTDEGGEPQSVGWPTQVIVSKCGKFTYCTDIHIETGYAQGLLLLNKCKEK